MRKAWTWAAAVALAAGACAPSLGRVAVAAGEGDLARLAGEWTGEYASVQTGRGGSIVFRLVAGADAAEGDVVMVPRGAAGPLQPAPMPGVAGGEIADSRRVPQQLAIRFVRVEGNAVAGTLEPYRDPECGCPVTTTFHGEVRGDRIEGTFVTRGGDGHPESGGTWRVERRR